MPSSKLGPFHLDTVTQGDSRTLIPLLPDQSIDVLVTSPPYWGQRDTPGLGTENDPRVYLRNLLEIFARFLPKLKERGIMWINIGDTYNTPNNWRVEDRKYSTLGPYKHGLSPNNSAYIKPRLRRRAFVDKSTPWLKYGALLALPERLLVGLAELGYLYRGQVIWYKDNPLPEGRCRRPHRHHELIYLFAKSEKHFFRVKPPVPSVWCFPNEKLIDHRHFARFPLELPKRCIAAYGKAGPDVVVLDPFSGSGTTGIAALELGCRYIGFEIDPQQAAASSERLRHHLRSLEIVRSSPPSLNTAGLGSGSSVQHHRSSAQRKDQIVHQRPQIEFDW